MLYSSDYSWIWNRLLMVSGVLCDKCALILQ